MEENTDNNQESYTKGVSILLGDPKKALIKLSIPVIIAMVINSLYAIIDGIWVAGIGDTALAAVGFVNPLYLIVFGFSNGIGAGATAIISRYIGAKDKKQADNAAMHVLLLTIILTIIFTVILTLFLKPILLTIGTSADVIQLSLDYGSILFLGSIFIVFSSTAYGILRAEGNVNKTTYAMLFGAILNIILDPIFIYVFDLGVSGAAVATVISMALVSLILIYWFKDGTYIKFSLKNFIFDKLLIKQILNVGLPAGTEFLIISILSASLNIILSIVGGVSAVAIYTVGWRVVLLAMVPTIGLGISVVAITGANFGAKKFKNIEILYKHGIKIGMIIVIALAIAIFALAPYISYLFAYSPESAGIRHLLTDFLRVTCLFYLVLPFGIVSSSIFQGLGKGVHSLTITLIRILFLEIFFSYLFAIPLGLGQYGVWYGIVVGNVVGCFIGFTWVYKYIKQLIS